MANPDKVLVYKLVRFTPPIKVTSSARTTSTDHVSQTGTSCLFGTTADTKACDDNYANVFTSTVTGKTEDIMNHIYTVTFAAAVNVFTFYIDLP